MAFVAYVAVENIARIRDLGRQVDPLTFGIALLGVVALSFGSLMLQICAWMVLIRGAGESSAPTRNAIWLFGRTAVGKYLPGNVFHYLGRQVLGMDLGYTQRGIFAASIAEAAVVVAASCTVAVAAIITAGSAFQAKGTTAALIVGILLPLGALLGSRVASRQRYLSWLTPLARMSSKAWAGAYVLYVAFVISGAAAFIAMLTVLWDAPSLASLSLVLAAYGASYVIGFLTPGAPGGIGVREALLVIFLAPEIEQSAVVFAAILHRLGSIAVEAILFASTFFFAPVRDAGHVRIAGR